MSTGALVTTDCREHALHLMCQGEPVLGVVSTPTGPASACGVVIVVGGPQYRIGSHRQFVELARAVAAAGFTCLRFDLRGMGDSGGQHPGFDQSHRDVGAAIDALLADQAHLQRVVLWGLCDAASAALLYVQATRDPRVHGLGLLNPWVRSEQGLAQTHLRHWYLRRLTQADFWRKLLRGGVGWGAVRGLWRTWRAARADTAAATPAQPAQDGPFLARMLAGLQAHRGPVLVHVSTDDHTGLEFSERCKTDPAWARAMAQPTVTLRQVVDGGHTLSPPAARAQLERELVDWLQAHTPAR
ncbi:MAG: hydrolase 1, exosortase A system-associated [Rubrivivax sp.]